MSRRYADLLVLSLFCGALLACASVNPKRRTHNAVAVPRHVYPSTVALIEDDKFRFGFDIRENQANAYTDEGRVSDASIFAINFEFGLGDDFAFGLGPYLGFAGTGATDERWSVGGEAFFRWRYLHTPQLSLFLYPTLSAIEGESEYNGCSGLSASNTLTCSSAFTARSKTEVTEPGLGTLLDLSFSDIHHLWVSPMVYRTMFKSKNELTGEPTIERNVAQWNAAVYTYYVVQWGQRRVRSAFLIGGGAGTARPWDGDSHNPRYKLYGSASFRFSI